MITVRVITCMYKKGVKTHNTTRNNLVQILYTATFLGRNILCVINAIFE